MLNLAVGSGGVNQSAGGDAILASSTRVLRALPYAPGRTRATGRSSELHGFGRCIDDQTMPIMGLDSYLE
ncbi:MAG TPA: hypothetical protein VGR42_12265 [Casimicrobiaceae bacterium]|nr:hypothetical protein [Casimicrobiaceae bacterium]